MKTAIAEKIKKAIESAPYGSSFSLFSSIILGPCGEINPLPVGVCEAKKVDDIGRTVLARYRYADGSALTYSATTAGSADRYTID